MYFLKYFINKSLNENQSIEKNNSKVIIRRIKYQAASKKDKFNSNGINEILLEYKEFKYLYEKTKIPPVYLACLLIICLIIMVIGYLENLLTFLIALLYPLYYSIKALRERNRQKIRNWLKYWIIFSVFINCEGVIAFFLEDIPLYFFYKVVFLLICFLPHYNGAKYFYENFIKNIFNKYENQMYDISIKLARKIKTTLLDSDIEKEYEGDINCNED